MAKAKYDAQTIYNELSTRQKTYDVFKVQMPGGSKTTGLIRVESTQRQKCKNLIVNILSDIKQPYKEVKKTTISSFPHLQINNLLLSNKGKKPETLRIVFKFPKGVDQPDYAKMWNPLMVDFFKSQQTLKRVPKNRDEIGVLTEINQRIYELSGEQSVKVKIGNVTANNIIGVIGGVGNKHADLVFISDQRPFERIFLSYKSGFGAKDFQQYSGISNISGLANTNEVKKWRGDVVKNWDAETPTRWRSIGSARLKRNAVMGSGAANGSLKKGNHSACQVFAQGTPSLKGNAKDGITITFDAKLLTNTNGQVASLDNTGYEPTLGARKGEAARRITAPGGIFGTKVLRGVRGGIYSREYLTTRRNSKPLE
tara:strand:- start:272 stop:1378 length:1107 start_codon:yes stop_codon:yes gene_type:complete